MQSEFELVFHRHDYSRDFLITLLILFLSYSKKEKAYLLQADLFFTSRKRGKCLLRFHCVSFSHFTA